MQHKSLTLVFLITLLFSLSAYSQSDSTATYKQYVIIKNDGTEFIGRILSQDAREVLIVTLNLGEVIIPKHEIKEIKELKAGDLDKGGRYIANEMFSTRYFFSSNGISMKKGEGYIKWGLFGPEIEYAVDDNFTIGAGSSWLAIPLIGSAKYTFKVAETVNIGVGTLLGTGSWASPNFGLALPYGSVTFGNEKKNLTFSGGYLTVFGNGEADGIALFAIAGLIKGGNKLSFVFDSFIVPNPLDNSEPLAVLIPGLRFQSSDRKAFQFGLAGGFNGRSGSPLAFPTVQWYRKL